MKTKQRAGAILILAITAYVIFLKLVKHKLGNE